ncbi:MAG: hypothetical protein V4737_11075 [Curtobacterium sp.]
MSTAAADDARVDRDPRSSFDVSGAHPDEAVRMYEEAYEGAGFSADRTDRPFGYRFKVIGDDTMTFRSTRFDGRMRGEVEFKE